MSDREDFERLRQVMTEVAIAMVKIDVGLNTGTGTIAGGDLTMLAKRLYKAAKMEGPPDV